MLNDQNPTQSTNQCRTLKNKVEKFKKVAKMVTAKNKKRNYNPRKEKIRALAQFTQEH